MAALAGVDLNRRRARRANRERSNQRDDRWEEYEFAKRVLRSHLGVTGAMPCAFFLLGIWFAPPDFQAWSKHALVAYAMKKYSAKKPGMILINNSWGGGGFSQAMQDAIERALSRWPVEGIPDNPAGWLSITARRRAVDVLRRAGCLACNWFAIVFAIILAARQLSAGR